MIFTVDGWRVLEVLVFLRFARLARYIRDRGSHSGLFRYFRGEGWSSDITVFASFHIVINRREFLIR